MAKIKILNVDDEPINGMMFRTVFNNSYSVLTAESGIDALEVLRNNNDIDVVISDMKMPGMNGLEFIKKALDLYPEIKYYIHTGYNMTPEIKESLETGLISKCFFKPLNIKEIDETLKMAFPDK